MSYDIKCYALAASFLFDVPAAEGKDIDRLAQVIQDATEGWIRFEFGEDASEANKNRADGLEESSSSKQA